MRDQTSGRSSFSLKQLLIGVGNATMKFLKVSTMFCTESGCADDVVEYRPANQTECRMEECGCWEKEASPLVISSLSGLCTYPLGHGRFYSNSRHIQEILCPAFRHQFSL